MWRVRLFRTAAGPSRFREPEMAYWSTCSSMASRTILHIDSKRQIV
jgi:hypothetical protein